MSEALMLALAESEARIQFLVDYMAERGLLEENTFTFPDGETWTSSTPDPEK